MQKRSRTDVWIVFIILFSVVAVYAQIANHLFLNYDDPLYISENPIVQKGLTRDGIAWAFSFESKTVWYPVTWLSHMVAVQLFGLKPGMHLLLNLFFHVLNCLMLFLFMRYSTRSLWASACVAALFGLHPLHVESVAWLSERKDVLSTFFWMATLMSYLYYTRRPSLVRYMWPLLIFSLGLLSKPMVVTLPFVLLLVDVWPIERFSLNENRKDWGGSIASLFLEKIPFFLLSILFSAITISVVNSLKTTTGLELLPLGTRLINAAVAYAAYIVKMIFPVGLSVIYPYPECYALWQIVGSVLLVGGLSVFSIGSIRRRPYMAVGWFWYLGTLVPVIGLVQVGLQGLANRFTYVPLIGLYMLLVWSYHDLPESSPVVRRAKRMGMVAVLIVLSVMSYQQVTYWQNSVTLFRHALDVTRRNYVAHTNLALALLGEGKTDAAIGQFHKALAINPDFKEARIKMGPVLLRENRFIEALANYGRVSGDYPEFAEIQFNLGNALAEMHRFEEAIAHYNRALKANPKFPDCHNNMGMAMVAKGHLKEGIFHFRQALQIKNDFLEAKNNLRIAQAQLAAQKE